MAQNLVSTRSGILLDTRLMAAHHVPLVHAGSWLLTTVATKLSLMSKMPRVFGLLILVLTDSLGNSRTYYRDELESMQLAKTVEISGGATDFIVIGSNS